MFGGAPFRGGGFLSHGFCQLPDGQTRRSVNSRQRFKGWVLNGPEHPSVDKIILHEWGIETTQSMGISMAWNPQLSCLLFHCYWLRNSPFEVHLIQDITAVIACFQYEYSCHVFVHLMLMRTIHPSFITVHPAEGRSLQL